MKNRNIVLVRGFDIFFDDADAKTLSNISKQLGGRHSFSIKEGRASYMFERIRSVMVKDIKSIHKTVDNIGEEIGISYECIYRGSELYITCCPKTLQALEASNIEFTFA